MQVIRESKTIAEQVEIAEQIFREVQQAAVDPRNEQAMTELIKGIAERHRDFYVTHPIIVKYMCHMRSYDSAAFYGYLDKLSRTPGKTNKVDGFLDAQADYVVRLAKTVSGKLKGRKARDFKKEVLAMLREEYRAMEEQYEVAKKVVDAEQEKNLLKARKEFSAAIAGGVSNLGITRVELSKDQAGLVGSDRVIRSPLHGSLPAEDRTVTIRREAQLGPSPLPICADEFL